MAVLIGASILIEAERGRLDVKSHVAQRQGEEFFLSVITASKLLHGVHRAVQPEVRTKRAVFVEGILERFPLLPVDLATARAHAQVWAALMAAGQMIGRMICGWRPPVLLTDSPWSRPMCANLRGCQDCKWRSGAGWARMSGCAKVSPKPWE